MHNLELIYIPGLSGKKTLGYHFLHHYANKKGINIHFFRPEWKGQEPFSKKLERVTSLIDQISDQDHRVGLIGVSAGGSLALNALYERSDIVGVVNICGRLRRGAGVRPSLERASKKSQSFKESVIKAEKRQELFSVGQRALILTVFGLFDETVPTPTSKLEGAVAIRVLSIGHSINIFVALSFKTKKIIDILNTW